MGRYTGLIVRSEDLDQYPVLSTATHSMHEDLVRILCELSAWHREHDCGYGNISTGSLRSDSDGRCLVDMTRRGPSLCEKARKTDPDAQRFVNSGHKPEPIDDLVSLGVAAAELIIAPGKRPAIEPTGTPYPKLLRDRLKSRPWHFGKKARRNRLIKHLLRASQEGLSSAAECLRSSGELLVLQPDGSAKPASPMQLVQSYPKSAVAVAGTFLLAILFLWSLRPGQTSEPPSVAQTEPMPNQFEDENTQLKGQIEELRRQLASIESAPPTTPVEPAVPKIELVSLSEIRTDPLFLKFADDPQFKNQKTKSILAAGEVPMAEFNYLIGRMQDFEKASRIWWAWAADMASEKEIDLEMDKFEDTIARILRGWRSELARSKTYPVTVRELRVPDTEEQFDVWIGEQEETYLFDEQGKLGAADGGEFRVAWSYAQPLAVVVEERGTLYDADVFRFEAKGALSIYTLASQTFGPSDASYRIKFRVKDLPGPPNASASVGSVTATTSGGSGENTPGDSPAAEAGKPETPIDPIDVIRSQI